MAPAALGLVLVMMSTVNGCRSASSGAAGATDPGASRSKAAAEGPPSTSGGNIVVLAAADLNPVLDELAPTFATKTGVTVTVSVGATAELAQQVRTGAPVDVFLAADTSSLDQPDARRLLLPGSIRTYARGRLVLVHRSGLVPAPTTLAALRPAGVGRIALANPEAAPYGRAAEQALTAVGLWKGVGSRLIFAESTAQARQLVASGNAGVGFVPLSLAIAAGEPYLPVPQESYAPLDEGLAIVASSKQRAAAQAFVAYLTGPDGRAALEKYGFEVPSTP